MRFCSYELPDDSPQDDTTMILAYSKLYDKRAGSIENEFKESKQGIGINKRAKKRFEGQ